MENRAWELFKLPLVPTSSSGLVVKKEKKLIVCHQNVQYGDFLWLSVGVWGVAVNELFLFLKLWNINLDQNNSCTLSGLLHFSVTIHTFITSQKPQFIFTNVMKADHHGSVEQKQGSCSSHHFSVLTNSRETAQFTAGRTVCDSVTLSSGRNTWSLRYLSAYHWF